MSFWQTSSGEKATGEVQENSSGFDPLPKEWYTCMLEEVGVNDYQGKRSIRIKARVVQEQYKNRVLFLSLKCFEFDGPDYKESTRDNAIQKLVKLYQICKAKLPDGEPDDRSLGQLIDKPVDLMLDVWEIDDKSGNWIVNVRARGEVVNAKSVAKTTAKPSFKAEPKPAPVHGGGFDDMDDDIPF